MPKPGDIINSKYRLLSELGAGAMGVVFAAVHLDTEKQLALKWLNPAISRLPTSAERFKLEAKATGRIHHPNVVVVHDCSEHEGQLYLVMEHLVGQTLRAYLAAAPEGRLPLEAALGVLFPVLRGVAAAHAVGVLHRDLKPENIFLAESPDGLPPIPKVLDFGLAKLRSEVSVVSKLSVSGSVLGTFQYMAPEQLRPNGELDERVDVYALGAILYELLTATSPYQADNPIDLLLQLQGPAPAPVNAHVPELSDQVSNVVARALARDPALRYANVGAFALELEPFSQHRFRGNAPRTAMPAAPAQPAPLSVTQHFDGRRAALAADGGPHVQVRGRPHWLQLGLGAGLLFLNPVAAESPPAHPDAETVPHQEPASPRILESLTQPSALPAQPEAAPDWQPATSAPPPSASGSEPIAPQSRQAATVRQPAPPPPGAAQTAAPTAGPSLEPPTTPKATLAPQHPAKSTRAPGSMKIYEF